MSWKVEVIADRSGKWCGNGLRFATEQEAKDNVFNLAMKWSAVRDTRVVECSDPVNYRWITNGLERVIDTSEIPEAQEDWFKKAKLIKPE